MSKKFKVEVIPTKEISKFSRDENNIMWLVYNVKTLDIHARCYSKKTAKVKLAFLRRVRGKVFELDKLDLDIMTLDKWKFWRIMCRQEN